MSAFLSANSLSVSTPLVSQLTQLGQQRDSIPAPACSGRGLLIVSTAPPAPVRVGRDAASYSIGRQEDARAVNLHAGASRYYLADQVVVDALRPPETAVCSNDPPICQHDGPLLARECPGFCVGIGSRKEIDVDHNLKQDG